jgi:serine/threonine protein kinase
VYEGVDRRTGQTVAIKIIPLLDQDDEEFAHLQKEIQLLSECNHPNVVRYYVSIPPHTHLSRSCSSVLLNGAMRVCTSAKGVTAALTTQ